ncbi:hypothetical protein CsSME_00023059 [Camellia sinensis var. sinensis]
MPGLSHLHEMGVSGRLIHEAYVTVPSSYLTALDVASWNCMTCLRVESECGFYSNGANPAKKIGLNPSIFSCNFLLKCLAEANRVEYLASLFEEIKKSGPLPNPAKSYYYNAVIDGFCKRGEEDEALRVMGEMKSCGISPDVCSYWTSKVKVTVFS